MSLFITLSYFPCILYLDAAYLQLLLILNLKELMDEHVKYKGFQGAVPKKWTGQKDRTILSGSRMYCFQKRCNIYLTNY
jgi:hypothetical protein